LSETIGKLTTDEIVASNVVGKDVILIIESFEEEILLDAKRHLVAAGIAAVYFLAIDSTKMVDCSIEALAAKFDGLSIATHMLLSSDSWVPACHALGLKVWVYTARAEKATTTIEAYYEELIQTGVDGIFADQPDLLRRVLTERG
jgi:glycerophosphoryl diester phosphodiesterase